jgi:uncharacterized protein (UPF0212 family)
MRKWMLQVKTGAGVREIFLFADSREHAERLFRQQWGVAFKHFCEVLSIKEVEND